MDCALCAHSDPFCSVKGEFGNGAMRDSLVKKGWPWRYFSIEVGLIAG